MWYQLVVRMKNLIDWQCYITMPTAYTVLQRGDVLQLSRMKNLAALVPIEPLTLGANQMSR